MLVIFFAICGWLAATHISRVNGVEITEDWPRQPANEMFSIKRRF